MALQNVETTYIDNGLVVVEPILHRIKEVVLQFVDFQPVCKLDNIENKTSSAELERSIVLSQSQATKTSKVRVSTFARSILFDVPFPQSSKPVAKYGLLATSNSL